MSNFDDPNLQASELSEEDHARIRGFLGKWQAPPADPAAKMATMAALYAEWDALETRSAATPQAGPLHWVPTSSRWSVQRAWLILRSQIRLVHRFVWAGTIVILALGMLVSLAVSPSSGGTGSLPFVLVAPIIAALGVALLYGEDTDPPLELQLATPIPPRVVLLARLALLFGFNLGVALIASLLLAAVRSDITFMPLVLSWLAPMTLLSALAFLCSVVLFDAALSAIISLLIWIALVWRHLGGTTLTPTVSAILPDLWNANLQPVLFITAIAAVLLALFLADREMRWTHSGES